MELELLEDLSPAEELLQGDVVDLLRAHQQLIELQVIHPTNDQKTLFLPLLFIPAIKRGLKVHPLELDNGVGVDPLRRDLSIQPELLDLDGPELVDGLCRGRVQEHADLEVGRHVVDVLEQLPAL